ncbi:MAG: diphthamide biosynthesis enzyme Dph2 [Candidatus Caldarchaeum sp.]
MTVIEGCSVDLQHAVESLKEIGACRVLVQSPLGFRKIAVKVGEMLEKEGFDVTLSSSNCWGGCDVAYYEAFASDIDAIIHLGHSRFLRRDTRPTIYLECRYVDDRPLRSLIPQIAEALKGSGTVGLGSSVQWLDHLNVVADELKKTGLEILTAEPSMYAVETAQVLGCDVSALKKLENDVDAFLVVGSVFHGLGISLLTKKPSYAADPHTQKVKNLWEMRERILKQRYYNIERFKKCDNVAVLVSVKPGQKRLGMARKINRMLKSFGKNSFILVTDEITVNTVMENRFDGFVNTACPRLSIEDQSQFSKPVLLPAEAMISLGVLKWEEVVDMGFLMYPWGWTGQDMDRKFWKPLREVVT